MSKDNLSELTVEDILGLLNSPQEEIVTEVRNLIKDQFSTISDKWLMVGLLDYFFSTNSKRCLDLIIGAPEPHSKYLLERITAGIRSSSERYRYISILLYAVSKNPPPIWVYKIPNTVAKDLLEALSPSKESDINVLISGVMVLVLLLPLQPLELSKFLPKMCDCFWRLVHWTPSKEQDSAFKPYLQVVVYSLFHRLYALYPCSLLSYLRNNMAGQANKSWFLSTLRPMLERVRLHPLLVSETKDTEVSRSRWLGLEPNDLIHECAKLCLDPLQEICEEVTVNRCSNRPSLSDLFCEASEYIILCSSENNFWSPGAESPPEAAVEATPETTPFTSPSPFVTSAKPKVPALQRISSKPKLPQGVESLQESPSACQSPSKKDQGLPFKFPSKYGQDILLKSEKSDLLQNKLQEIQRQRSVKQKEIESSPCVNDFLKDAAKPCTAIQEEQQLMSNETNKPATHDELRSESLEIHSKKELSRRRKVAVVIHNNYQELNAKFESDLFSEDSEAERERGESEKCTQDAYLLCSDENSNNDKSRKDSDDSEGGNNEGLGIPCRQSMTELVKSVKTNRLRFLSQCGPPPNISLLNELGTKKSVSPTKPNRPCLLKTVHRSLSFPDLSKGSLEIIVSSLPRRDFTISSLSLSPVKPPVESFEVATQTEEAPILEPHEHLLEVLMVPLHSRKKEGEEGKDNMSPYDLLDRFIQYTCHENAMECPDASWEVANSDLSLKCKSHLRSMYCLLTLERYKREVHAERNRRLLGKIKKLHSLQEKDIKLYKEKAYMKEEMMNMHQTVLKLQEENSVLEKKLSEMVDKEALTETQKNQEKASLQRDHLKRMCDSLLKEKSSLTKELENVRSTVREYQRQLKIQVRHSNENTVLRRQVEELNKKILLMGEIQLEMHQQMKNYKDSQRQFRNNVLSMEKAAFAEKIQELKYRNNAEKTSLQAAMFRIRELEKKLVMQHLEKVEHRKEIESTIASWKERCDALEKRNQELCSINITIESQMTQLLRFRPEREDEEGAGARRLVPPTGKDGFPPPVGLLEDLQHFPEEAIGPYISGMTSKEFRGIEPQSPDNDEYAS